MSARPVLFRSRRKQGFTLVELLVAITILAIVAVLGWRGLDGIVRARIALSAQLEQTRGMQLTFAQLQSDCAHIVNNSTVPSRQPLFQDTERLTLVRTVLVDDQPTRLQVVSYRLRDGVLTRRESPATRDLEELDKLEVATTNDADSAQEVVLQTGIRSMSTRIWIPNVGWMSLADYTKRTITTTSSSGSNEPPPPGLEVQLVLQGSEVNVTKVFLLGPV